MINEEQNIVNRLAAIGVEVEGIYDLVNSKEPYPAAVPVLIAVLQEGINDERLLEGVIRALTVVEARGISSPVLLAEFKKRVKDNFVLCWVIGNALAVVSAESDLDEMLAIATNRSNGRSREMVVEALGRFQSPRVEHVLIELLEDEQVAVHALRALGQLRSKAAAEKVMALLDHPKPLMRKEAKRAISRILKGVNA